MKRFFFSTILRGGLAALITLGSLGATGYAQVITTFDPPNSIYTVPQAINPFARSQAITKTRMASPPTVFCGSRTARLPRSRSSKLTAPGQLLPQTSTFLARSRATLSGHSSPAASCGRSMAPSSYSMDFLARMQRSPQRPSRRLIQIAP